MYKRQEYNLSAAASGQKYNVYSSVGYLNEKGYVKATGYERFSGRINTTSVSYTHLYLHLNIFCNQKGIILTP